MGYELFLLIGLIGAGAVFLLSPQKAVLTLAALISLWVEWTFPQLFGLKAGLLDAAVIGGFLGLAFLTTPKPDQGKIPFKGMIAAYMIISVMSPLLSPYIVFNDTKRALWASYKEMYVTSSFFLFYILLFDKGLIRKAVNLVIFSATIASIVGIAQTVTGTPVDFLFTGTYADSVHQIALINSMGSNLRAFGTLWHANEFGGFLVLTLSISLTLFLLDKEYRQRKYLLLAILVQGLALMLTFSRGGWMGWLCSLAVIAFYTGIYRNASFISAMVVAGILLVSLRMVFPGMDLVPGNVSARFSSVKNFKEDPAMVPRFERWEYFYKMSLERPFIGSGAVTTEEANAHFDEYAASPHNSYLFVAAKRGYVALGIIVILIIKSALVGRKLYLSANDDFLRAIGLGCLAGLIGLFGVSSMFGSFLEETQVNLLFWFLLAVTLRGMSIFQTEQLSTKSLPV